MITKQLSCQQACWSEYLFCFNSVIQFWPGKLSAKPNTLTRRSKDLFKIENKRIKQILQTVLKEHNFNSVIALENSKLNLDLMPSTLVMLHT